MDEPSEDSAEEITKLRNCLNDLASIMALPAIWTNGEQAQIVSTLLDTILGMLRLDFACVRLNDPEDGRSVETIRVAASLQGTAEREISQAIELSLGDAALTWPPHAHIFI